MSFGFSIGDFVTVIDRANIIRRNFVGAPAQFKALSDEYCATMSLYDETILTDVFVNRVRNLTIVINDIKIDLSGTTLSDAQETRLQEIAVSCSNVLAGIEKTIERYSAIDAPHSFKRIWKRLKWKPDDASDLRNRLCSNIGLLNAINGRMTHDSVLDLLKYKSNEEDQQCLNWLSPTNYAIQQSNFIGRRQQGTGGWLPESLKFQVWLERPQQTLFCPGIPGAGKTIIASIVINELEVRFENNRDVGVAYLFCSFEHYDDQIQKPESLLASILRQLTQGLDSIPENIIALHAKHKANGTRPSFNEISKALRSIMSRLAWVFIVIDALDECNTSAISPILDEFFDIQLTTRLNILATSRFLPEIMARFQDRPTQEIRATNPDVMIYLNANLKKLPAFVSRNQQLQQEIVKKITAAADGM